MDDIHYQYSCWFCTSSGRRVWFHFTYIWCKIAQGIWQLGLYNPINPSIFAGSFCRAYHFDMVSQSTEYTQMHWLELPSDIKVWFDILTCLTKYFYSSAHICGISYMSPHTMITQLKTFHSKVVHNCYWYADYTHCLWINDALVTRHETWLA